MSNSSILGGEHAPSHSSGKTAGLLGPSDSSDSGSDSMGELGSDQLDSDSDRAGTGERGAVEADEGGSGADIRPDRVVRLAEDGEFLEGEEDGDALMADDTDELEDVDDLTDVEDDASEDADRT